jgi:hypothetical protein
MTFSIVPIKQTPNGGGELIISTISLLSSPGLPCDSQELHLHLDIHRTVHTHLVETLFVRCEETSAI